MEILKNEKFRNFIINFSKIMLVLLIAISIFILNFSQIVSPDDYTYSVILGNFDLPIDSVGDLLINAKYFYNNWTGRIIPHTLIGIFRNLNPHIFETVNTLVFMIFIIMISKIIPKKSSYLGILSVFGYFTYSMMFGEKFSWISGALNYLWPSCFMAIFIFYIYKYFYEDKSFNILGKIVFVLFAFVTGFMHETSTFVTGSFLAILYIANINKIKQLPKKEKIFVAIVFILFCIGAAFTIFAPGNFARKGIDNTSFSWNFLKNYSDSIFHIILCLISIGLIYRLHDKKLAKNELLLFILPVIIATIPMAIIGEFPERAFIFYEVLLAACLSGNIAIITEKYKSHIYILIGSTVLFTLIVFARFSPSTLAEIRYIIPYKYEVQSILEKNSRKMDERILIPSFKYMPWIHAEDRININNFFIDWREDLPINVYTAKKYRLGSVKSIADDEYLVELTVDTKEDEYNTYVIWDITNGDRIREMSYYNHIEYPLKKDKLGIYKIDGLEKNLLDKVLEIKLFTIEDGEIDSSNIKPEDIIFYKEKGDN